MRFILLFVVLASAAFAQLPVSVGLKAGYVNNTSPGSEILPFKGGPYLELSLPILPTFETGFMVGMKPAGGIRAAKEALHYLVMIKETLGDRWLHPDWFRFGASTLVNDLLRQLARHAPGSPASGRYAARYDFSEA